MGEQVVFQLPKDLNRAAVLNKKIKEIELRLALEPQAGYTVFKADAKAGKATELYLELRGNYVEGTPYNFNGEVKGNEIYRQSPHDLDAWIVTTIPEQAVPVVALKHAKGFTIALNGAPALYDNFTSQEYYAERKTIALCSGDSGRSPGIQPDTSKVLNLEYNAENGQKFTPGKVIRHFHRLAPGQSHHFEGLIVESVAQHFNGLRKDVNLFAARHFSGGKVANYFGALAFTTAFMNLRTNDSGKSKYWVVPSVEYGNTQYGRDAFWIATMLPPKYDAECMKSELHTVNPFAEYPLFAIIWAYRAFKSGNQVEMPKVQAYVDEIERRARDHSYFSYDARTGRMDFQYWGDVMAFETDDLIAFNQGLFALALRAAREMGLKIVSNPEMAAERYRSLFNEDLKLLPSQQVQRHFARMQAYSRTEQGYKIVASADGAYLPAEQYDVPGYVSQVNREKMPDGHFFRGGSYFLYDNLFLIDAYLHGIAGAEEALMWRIGLDFATGNTTYECRNTRNGETLKPNMGWNVAIYAFWQTLVDAKKADGKLFSHIDQIAAQSDAKH
jgi:hypothetical protein